MNLHLLGTPAVLLAGIAALALGLAAPTADDAPDAAAARSAPVTLVPAARALGPVVPGTTWGTDPFSMTRLGERQGANLPFPPPPPVDLPPLPTMPFRQAP